MTSVFENYLFMCFSLFILFCSADYKLFFCYMKVVRDQDGHIYFREYDGCIVAGGFEPVAKPAYEDGNFPRICSLIICK